MNFDTFDNDINVDGYFEHFHNLMFPLTTPTSINLRKFQMKSRTFAEGSVFTRVRKIEKENTYKFFAKNLKPDEFFPPNPVSMSIRSGRFNNENESVIYLADSIETAIKECDIQVGDHFLYTNLSLLKEMHFIELGFDSGEDKLLNDLCKLVNTRDRLFYPVISKVYSYFFKFSEMNGAVYPSTRLNNDEFSESKSPVNLAINGIERNKLKFTGGFLLYLEGRCKLTGNYHISEKAIYLPRDSRKNKKKLRTIKHDNNELEFIKESKKYMKFHIKNKAASINKLERGEYHRFKNELFKIIQRD